MYSNKSIHEFYDVNNFQSHFDKKFTFSNNEFNFKDNESNEFNELFDDKEWTVDDLQLIGENIYRVKCKLNNYSLNDWSYHTNKFGLLNIRHSYKSFPKLPDHQIKPELFTRAWIKLFEILVRLDLKDNLLKSINSNEQINCLFLCEAPGR